MGRGRRRGRGGRGGGGRGGRGGGEGGDKGGGEGPVKVGGWFGFGVTPDFSVFVLLCFGWINNNNNNNNNNCK